MKKNILRTALIAVPILAASALGQNNNGLEWSTYIGGSKTEITAGFRGGTLVAGNGDVLAWGITSSADFPTTPGAYDTTYNGSGPRNAGDGWIARIKADGSGLVWSTYLGGTGDDYVAGLVLEPTGVITVSGFTSSADFPTTAGAFDTTYNGSGADGYGDAFVARFVWTGSKLDLVWSTYLGGKDDEIGFPLAVHPTGAVVVAGRTRSSGFPTTPSAFDTTHNGNFDGFVAVLSADGRKLTASTFLGGSDFERLGDLTLDAAGNPVVSGLTNSTNFPTTPNAYQGVHAGVADGYVCRFDLALSRLTYSTFLGGSAWDKLAQVEITPAGTFVVAGWTASTNFPTTADSYASTYQGGPHDGCVTMLDPSRTGSAQLLWSTFLGGSSNGGIDSLALERSGLITVAGETVSSDFPATPGAFQTTQPGGPDAFVARLDPGASPSQRQLVYATYLGGKSDTDLAFSVKVDGLGNAVVAGVTSSSGFPVTSGAFDTTHNGGQDVFVSKLTMLPKGIQRHGWSTPACLWPIYQGVGGWPRAGTSFTIRVTGVAPNAPGVVAFGPTPNTVGLPLLNVLLFADPPWFVLPMVADTSGLARLGVSIPGTVPTGTRASVQWLFETTAKCPGTGPFSTSEVIEITIQ